MREFTGLVLALVGLGGCKLCFEPVCEAAMDGAGGGSDAPPGTFIAARRIGGAWGPAIDLTAEGLIDWRHWGLGGTPARNQKAGVPSRISDFTHLGGGTIVNGNGTIDETDPLRWSDGAPTASVASTTEYIMVDTAGPQGDGWELAVAGEDAVRTLTLYVANWCLRTKLEVAFDDGGAPPYIDTTWQIAGSRSEIARYVIEFRSTSAATLRARFTVDQNYCTTGDLGEAKLQAATLR